MTLIDFLIAAVILGIAGTDLLIMKYLNTSYSQGFRRWGQKLSFFPYAWGVLGGHFFSPWDNPIVMLHWHYILVTLLSVGVALSLANAILRWAGWDTKWAMLFVYFPIGAIFGVLFWVA